MAEVALNDEGGRVLKEAENFCWQSRVAILAPEHLLGAALLVLGETRTGLPSVEDVAGAFQKTQGTGSQELDANVMFGSAARDALNVVARMVREAGGTAIGALEIAAGVIASGEVNPMFYGELGWSREALREGIGSGG